MGMWIAIGTALLLIALAGIWIVLRKHRSEDEDRVIRSIVLLLAEPRRPSEDEIAAAVRSAWGARLARGPDAGDGDFLMHLPSGPPSCVAMRVNNVMYLINSVDRPYSDEDAHKSVMNERVARILREHKGWTSVDIFGDPPPDWTSQRLYARLGRLAAQLADDNTLGFYLTEFDQIFPNVPTTFTALTSSDPLKNLNLGAPLPIVNIEDDDAEMAAAVEEAQTRLPEFLRLFEENNPKHRFAVKAPLTSAKTGHTEFIWSLVNSIDDSNVHATLDNDPGNLPEYKAGQELTIRLDDVVDWLVSEGKGIVVGGFSVKVLMERAKR